MSVPVLSAASEPAPTDVLHALSHWVDPVSPDTHCDAVYERFSKEANLLTLPVVEGTRPLGLINRQRFLVRLADRFGRALFEQKPIARLMDDNPLIVQDNMHIEELGAHIVNTCPSALLEGFIVVKDGAYRGMGSALSLLTLTLEDAQRRNAQLDEARKRAETASKSKTEFLANMSHELRTPLNAIIGFSEMLSEQMFGPLGQDRYLDYARDITESGRHLLGIINDILDLAKVEAGKLELVESDIDLDDLMTACFRLMNDRARARGIALAMSPLTMSCTLRVDPRLLKQVLLNLLSNAVKFNKACGVVEFSAEALSDGGVAIVVRDTGVGMSESDMAKAVEPFAQVDSRLNRRYEGAGLGLPLVQRMTEAHGGSFKLESTPGHGTSARVILPAARVRQRAATRGRARTAG